MAIYLKHQIINRMEVNDPQENYKTGYIKLYRSLKNKGYYTDSHYVHLWVHLLIRANHLGKEFLFNNELIKIKPGQFVTGREKLSFETGIKQWKIEKILKCFEKEGQIQQQSNSRNRMITILMWNKYQTDQQQTDSGATTKQQRADSEPTAEQQRDDTNKNVKNEKKKEKEILHSQFKEIYLEWHREEIKLEPLFDGSDAPALNTIIKNLRKNAERGGHGEQVDQVVVDSWKWILKKRKSWDMKGKSYNQSQTRVRQIATNLTSILINLKNEKGHYTADGSKIDEQWLEDLAKNSTYRQV